jgi:hypothetical protein
MSEKRSPFQMLILAQILLRFLLHSSITRLRIRALRTREGPESRQNGWTAISAALMTQFADQGFYGL